MANQRVVDELVTLFSYRTDTAALQGLEGRINRLRSGLNSASRGFTIAGLAMTAALAGVTKTIIGTETEFNRLRRDVDATEEQQRAMRALAIELGTSAEFSTSTVQDAAKAQRELAKAGLSVEEAMAATPDILRFVAAHEFEVGEAALAGAKLVKAFGLEMSQLGEVLDIVAFSSVNAGINAHQLTESLLRTGATAKGAGIDFREAAAAQSILVDSGIKNETAARSMIRIISLLKTASVLPPEAQRAITNLGVSIQDIENLMNQGDLIGTFRLLRDAGFDLAAASQIFGLMGQTSALVLADSVDAFDSFEQSLDGATGALKRQAGEMQEGLPGAVAAFKSSITGAISVTGDSGLTGTLEGVIRKATDLVGAFATAPPIVHKVTAAALLSGPALLGMGAALKGVSIALGGFIPAVKIFRGLSRAAVGAYDTIALRWLYTTDAMKGAGAGLARAWKRTTAGIRAAWASTTAAIQAAMAVTITRVKLFFATVKNHGVFGTLKIAWASTMAAMQAAMATTTARVKLFFATIRKHGVFGTMALAWAGAMAAMKAAGRSFVTSMVVGFQAIWASATLGLSLAFVALAGLILAAWKPVKTFFEGFYAGFMDRWPVLEERIKGVGRALTELPVVGPLFERIIEFFSQLINLFGDQTDAGERAGAAFADMLEGMAFRLQQWLLDLQAITFDKVGKEWGTSLRKAFLQALFGDITGGLVETLIRANEATKGILNPKFAFASFGAYGQAAERQGVTPAQDRPPIQRATPGQTPATVPTPAAVFLKTFAAEPVQTPAATPGQTPAAVFLKTFAAEPIQPPAATPGQPPAATPDYTLPVQPPAATPDYTLPVQPPAATPDYTFPVQPPAVTPDYTLPIQTPAAAPIQSPPSGAQFGPRRETRSVENHFTIERMDIHAEGGDPDDIAAGIESALSRALHNTAEDYDSDVAR